MHRMSMFRFRRIKELQRILAMFDSYPVMARALKYHRYRVQTYEWLLAYEKGLAASTPLTRLENALNDGSRIFQDVEEFMVVCSIFYNYHYNGIYSNI